MEATKEAGELLNKLRPPRIEDAGLKDCALPPESIKEAFLKAATAVRSIISQSSDDEAEGSCVNDPNPTFGDSSDSLVGIGEGLDDIPGDCTNKKGGGVPEVAGDKVAVQDDGEKVDELVVGGPNVAEPPDACIDALQGLEIGKKAGGIKGKMKKNADVDEDDEKPILAEGHMHNYRK